MTKPKNWDVRPAKTQTSLGIRPVWSESLLYAWRKLGSLAIHWAHSGDSDQTGRMPRLIWVCAGRASTLLVLSWGGSTKVCWLLYVDMAKTVTQVRIPLYIEWDRRVWFEYSNGRNGLVSFKVYCKIAPKILHLEWGSYRLGILNVVW